MCALTCHLNTIWNAIEGPVCVHTVCLFKVVHMFWPVLLLLKQFFLVLMCCRHTWWWYGMDNLPFLLNGSLFHSGFTLLCWMQIYQFAYGCLSILQNSLWCPAECADIIRSSPLTGFPVETTWFPITEWVRSYVSHFLMHIISTYSHYDKNFTHI